MKLTTKENMTYPKVRKTSLPHQKFGKALKVRTFDFFLIKCIMHESIVFCNGNDKNSCTKVIESSCTGLTHYSSVLLFCTPEKIRKPEGFLIFSGDIEKQHQAVMG